MAKITTAKKNTVKVGNTGVTENEAPLTENEETSVEETAPKNNRKSTRNSENKVNERPATKRKLGGNRRSARDPFWYLHHEGELEMVTAEGHNEVLGVKEIQVWDPSDAQWENGVLANVTLVMDYVTVKGVQVRESVRDDSGAIYLQTQSRSWEKDGQKQYMNDVELARPVQAQILSYVEAMLVEADAE
jgi:hypothetical protein